MKTKTIVFAFLVVTAGVFAYTRPHNAMPSDLRDAVADRGLPDYERDDNREFDTGMPDFSKSAGNIPVPKAAPVTKDYLRGNGPSAGRPSRPVEFVTLPAGRFLMGAGDEVAGFENAGPRHWVDIRAAFEMSRTQVTVEQYAECVAEGRCTKPGAGARCNWGKADKKFEPVNCVDWEQAGQFARFKGARLPSEAEWEYAAKDGEMDRRYSCDGGYPCFPPAAPCSKPARNTSTGLCDIVGKSWEWVQDTYRSSYKDAPSDGSAFEGTGPRRVVRGGVFRGLEQNGIRVDGRGGERPADKIDSIGFRIARPR